MSNSTDRNHSLGNIRKAYHESDMLPWKRAGPGRGVEDRGEGRTAEQQRLRRRKFMSLLNWKKHNESKSCNCSKCKLRVTAESSTSQPLPPALFTFASQYPPPAPSTLTLPPASSTLTSTSQLSPPYQSELAALLFLKSMSTSTSKPSPPYPSQFEYRLLPSLPSRSTAQSVPPHHPGLVSRLFSSCISSNRQSTPSTLKSQQSTSISSRPTLTSIPELELLQIPPPTVTIRRRYFRPNISTLSVNFKPSRRGVYNNVSNMEMRCYMTPMPFYCGHCYKIPEKPVTNSCGHTSCRDCLLKNNACGCGRPASYGIGVNILLKNLIESIPMPAIPEINRKPANRWLAPFKTTNCSRMEGRLMPPGFSSNSATRCVTAQMARLWLRNEELDCPICTNPYTQPITTYCGHTFCRSCLERVLDRKSVCPVCKMHMNWFDIDLIEENRFVAAALNISGAIPVKEKPDNRLPIFICIIAYPMVSCPLFVFEPRYRLMLRRCLNGNRLFGMISANLNKRQISHGTVLEIRDSVRLPNGCSLVSTIGVSRFKILKREEKDGYTVAHVSSLTDLQDNSPFFSQKELLKTILPLFLKWRKRIAQEDNLAIEQTYGPMPTMKIWNQNDGPAFVWWVTAFLPVQPSVKYSMLKKRNVMERLMLLRGCILRMLRKNVGPLIEERVPTVGPIIQMM